MMKAFFYFKSKQVEKSCFRCHSSENGELNDERIFFKVNKWKGVAFVAKEVALILLNINS